MTSTPQKAESIDPREAQIRAWAEEAAASVPAASVPAKTGRKTKRQPAVLTKLLKALSDGCTVRAACASAGIGEEAFYRWKEEFSEFSEAVTRAEDLAEAEYTAAMKVAATGGVLEKVTVRELSDGLKETTVERMDWRAAESWLKRRRRDEWSERIEQQHSGSMKLEITAEELTDDELASIAKAAGD